MITAKEYLKYLRENGLVAVKNVDNHVELCWHCRKSIARNQHFYAIKQGYAGAALGDRQIFFHKACFTEIAGEAYTFHEQQRI